LAGGKLDFSYTCILLFSMPVIKNFQKENLDKMSNPFLGLF
jgi:hypothetical protein